MPAQVPAKHVRVLGAIGDSEANRGRGGDRGRGRGRGGRGRGRGRGGGADLPEGIESHNVVVIRGTHKGMVGVITDTTETHVQVQMQATNKTVPVRIKDDQGRLTRVGCSGWLSVNYRAAGHVDFAESGRQGTLGLVGYSM